MVLAGVHHITIAPGFLQQLAAMPADTNVPKSLFDSAVTYEALPLRPFQNDEAAWRFAFTRRMNGEGERKLSQAVRFLGRAFSK
jgi:transaldolase